MFFSGRENLSFPTLVCDIGNKNKDEKRAVRAFLLNVRQSLVSVITTAAAVAAAPIHVYKNLCPFAPSFSRVSFSAPKLRNYYRGKTDAAAEFEKEVAGKDERETGNREREGRRGTDQMSRKEFSLVFHPLLINDGVREQAIQYMGSACRVRSLKWIATGGKWVQITPEN
jgi:hypothetical protein